jgi:hypothetical protein
LFITISALQLFRTGESTGLSEMTTLLFAVPPRISAHKTEATNLFSVMHSCLGQKPSADNIPVRQNRLGLLHVSSHHTSKFSPLNTPSG